MEEPGRRATGISSIYDISPTVLEALAQWLEQRGLATPVSQVVGYQQDRLVVKVAATSLTQSIPSGTQTDIIFQSTVTDKQKVFDGTSTFTLPYDGTYIVSGSQTFDSTGAAAGVDEFHAITQNGVMRAGQDKVTAASVLVPASTVSTLIVGSKGDRLKHVCFQGNAGSVKIFAATFELALLNRY